MEDILAARKFRRRKCRIKESISEIHRPTNLPFMAAVPWVGIKFCPKNFYGGERKGSNAGLFDKAK